MSAELTPGQIWRAEDNIPSNLEPGIVTIGNFDGVHRGHRQVIQALIQAGKSSQLRPRALTFRPHPRHVMSGGNEPELITSYHDRTRLLREAGIADVLDMEFTKAFAQHSAEDFVRIFLVELLAARAVVLGKDSRFGRGNEGDFATMQELGRTLGFDVLSVEDLGTTCTEGERISSSKIRAAIDAGDVGSAAEMLGRWHFVRDTVRHGFKRGRELGFPTANFSASPAGLIPGDGVYAGYFSVVDGDCFLQRMPATISVGTNPTFEEGPEHRLVETYVHGSHEYELYDREAKVEFVKKLRPTLTFEGIEPLIEQMHRDVAVTRSTLETASIPEA